MKKLLIPIVALLAFSMLSTSVSAFHAEYYLAGFYAEASGCCLVTTVPAALGKGSVHIKGLAIAYEETGNYRANRTMDPNTRLWTRRTRMTASWNNKKIKVFMWPSYTTNGTFRYTDNYCKLEGLSYFGYYKGEAGLQFISGTATVIFRNLGVSEIQYAVVLLYVGTALWFRFEWEAMSAGKVTIWPIGWP